MHFCLYKHSTWQCNSTLTSLCRYLLHSAICYDNLLYHWLHVLNHTLVYYSLLASFCMYLSDRTVMQYRCIMSTGSTYSYVQIWFYSYDTKAGSDLPPSLSFQIWWRPECKIKSRSPRNSIAVSKQQTSTSSGDDFQPHWNIVQIAF